MLSYNVLFNELGITSARELEDIVISGIYADILQASLDPHNQYVHITHTIGRDLQPGELQQLVDVLRRWCVKVGSS